VTYWDHQTKADVAVALVATTAVWLGPSFGAPILFAISSEDATQIARSWLGPILTLLAMTFATMSFIFTVIDRSEFNIIRGKHSESQLWRIFAQNIGWLTCSAIYCVVLVVVAPSTGTQPLAYLGSFLLFIMSICIMKYAWVMRQVLFVRIDQTRQ
jgi:hypothetical protein